MSDKSRRDQHHSSGVTLVSVALALAIILAAILAGCGGSGGDSKQGTTVINQPQEEQK